LEDVDVVDTAEKLAAAITGNTGQICCTATRWILHKNIAEDFKGAVIAALAKTRIGPGLDRETTMGPLVSQTQQNRVRGYFEKGCSAGAKVILDCKQPLEEGYFMSPWLLEGSADNLCFQEEIFGPAAFITTFSEEKEALDQIHSVDYGLANSVWSADLHRANRLARLMEVGNSWINAHNVFAYGLPYGGVNRSGMGGGVNSPDAFYDYLRNQTIARPL